MKRVFALIMLLVFISFGSVSGNAFESSRDPACSIPAADGVRQFASNYNIDGISNHTILDNVLQVPYEDGDAKDPRAYQDIIQPPQCRIRDGVATVTLFTWTEQKGLLLRWNIAMENNLIAHVSVTTIDYGVGHGLVSFEGFIPTPGKILVDESLLSGTLGTNAAVRAPADPGQIQVSDHWLEIRPNAGDSDSTTITVTGFGANEEVNIAITVDGNTIQDVSGNPVRITTNTNGDGSVVFRPTQNSRAGRARIEARSPTDQAVLEITDRTSYPHDSDPSDDERGGLTIEKTIERSATAGGRSVTFRVHYTDQNLQGYSQAIPQEMLNAAVNAYQTQAGTWGFNRHLGGDYDADNIVHIYISDGDWMFHFDRGTDSWPDNFPAEPMGRDRRINYQANLQNLLQSQGIFFGSLDYIVAHEHFHCIQFAYSGGDIKWGRDGQWYSEGTARFVDTLNDPVTAQNPNSLFYSMAFISPQHYMQNPDRPLTQYSYDYALFWGYLYANEGGIATIEQIFEHLRSAGGDAASDGPAAISTVLSTAPGAHNSFKDLVGDFSVAVYRKNLTWNGVNWGTHLRDVTLTSDETYSGAAINVPDLVNEWGTDYIVFRSTIENGVEVEFQGEEIFLVGSSQYIVRMILYDSTIPSGKVVDFVRDHKAREIVPKARDYTKIVFAIVCTGHPWLGDGDYSVIIKKPDSLDVVLDFDRSGSMGAPADKFAGAKNAGRTFIDLLEKPSGWWIFRADRDRVGLISFATSATLDRHLTSGFDDVKNMINGYAAAGTTNMGEALSISINELKANGRKDTIHTILYLTDGNTNAGMNPDQILNSLVPQAVEAGISIYTLGYGTDVDSGFLSQVASRGNGKYYFAPDSGTLMQIYTELSHTTKGWKHTASFSGTVTKGQTVQAGVLNIPSDTHLLKIVLTWGGSDLDLVLVDPDGNQKYPGAGTVYSGNDVLPEFYEIYDPKPGSWSIQVHGKETPTAGEKFTIMVFQPGALMLVKPTRWDIGYPQNREMIFNVAELTGNVDLTDVTFTASDLSDTSREDAVISAMAHSAEAEDRGERETITLSNITTQRSYHIPAGSFTFTPNRFIVPRGESRDVRALFTLPPGTPMGEYAGTITVTSSAGTTDILVTLKGTNLPPVAEAGGPYIGTTGSPITFDGSGSFDPDDAINSWRWDLNGDGTYETDATSSRGVVDHTWDSPYHGDVGLQVIDGFGATGEDTATVTVIPREIGASADTFIDSGFVTTFNRGGERVPVREMNFGDSTGLSVIRGRSSGRNYLYWQGILLSFDIPAIPPKAIKKATLYLYHYTVWDERVSAHRMKKDWHETESTFMQPIAGAPSWAANWKPEGNYAALPTDVVTVDAQNTWYSWDVTRDVKAFLSGTPNYGWFLKSAEDGPSDITSTAFYSRESTRYRPYLKINV